CKLVIDLQRFRWTRGTLVRMIADAILLQIALISGLSARFYFVIQFQDMGDITIQQLLQTYQLWYARTAAPLTALCLVVFFVTGFYTRGAFYQNRYKVLVVIQTVTASFVLYAFVVLFFGIYGGNLSIAKAALGLAWLFSIVLLAGARVWNEIWQKTALHDPVAATSASPSYVLIIGGGGYIGSALVPMMLEKGYRVRVLDLLLFGEEPLADVLDHPNLELIRGDFRNVDELVPALQNVASLVHLGAIVGDPACSLDESLTIDVNLSATRYVAELAKSHGIQRFVFASTCSVYGACDEILDERSEVMPVSLYGHTKRASEEVLLTMAGHDEFSPTILRFATIYGLSGRTRFDLVVNLLTAKAKLDGLITVQDGDQWRPFVHVEDAARAVLAVLEAPVEITRNEIFNVGSNEQNYTISQVGQKIAEQVISAEIQESSTSNDRRNYRVNFNKIRNLLDYHPQWTLELGIQQVLESIISGKVSDYREPKYSNVAFLTKSGTENLARDRWARELLERMQEQK
ncbi:MAG: NAD-dependent epimerase/dehydratase family protein, partial [Planctomycetales bacterium]|nr:NAD-dependent epimerase/dehydratase family protein [Planctomycetales bacterium]